MKNKVFGRKDGSQAPMVLLLEGNGVSTGGKRVEPEAIAEFALANTRRTVQMLREKNIEGYVLFENDPTHYEFTPEADFVYPSAIQ